MRISTETLSKKIKLTEDLTSEEKSVLLELINSKKKYGLIWEEKIELVEEKLRNSLPVLREVDQMKIENGSHAPNHFIVEGDNLHALTCLTFTHTDKIDVIYIDPPYNTGNKDFVYNDKFVDKDDLYKHSKWLSFISKRLKIAKSLLKNTGVIFISIDDNEQAQLKLLCDEIFGEINFIGNMIWSAGKKNDSKYISNSHEYILAYFKNKEEIKSNKTTWRIRKEGIDKIYSFASKFLKESKNNFDEASKKLKKWFKELPDDDPAKRHKHYSNIDQNGVFFADNISWPGGGGPKYEILHPTTGKPVKVPSRGWVYSSKERMDEIIKDGKVYFGNDENSVPTLKSYLKDREYEVPYSVLYKDGRASTKYLREILGGDYFNNPKDHEIILKLIEISSNPDSVILDFFAGSGTTLHSTMELNEQDGGRRKCILITNNENNIAEKVTYKRNKNIIYGYRNSNGDSIKGLRNNNLRYYQCDFVDRKHTLSNKRKLTSFCTELLCIKEDTYQEVTSLLENATWHRLFTDGKGKYVYIVFDDLYIDDAVTLLEEFISKHQPKAKVKVYVFSNGQYAYKEEFESLAGKVELAALPDAIYKALAQVLPKEQREDIPQLAEDFSDISNPISQS
jgi:adenine-specific DNA-methyltransferase